MSDLRGEVIKKFDELEDAVEEYEVRTAGNILSELRPMVIKLMKETEHAYVPGKGKEDLTVSQWADNYRVLTPETSGKPGKWDTNYTPYLRQIMDEVNNPNTRKVIFCHPVQVGASEALTNILGYVSHRKATENVSMVHPTTELTRHAYQNRIKTMIDSFRTFIEGRFISLLSSNKPTEIASKPLIQHLLIDGADFHNQEGLKVVMGRIKEGVDSKIFITSTPTTPQGRIWEELIKADVLYLWCITCPECGGAQPLWFHNLTLVEGKTLGKYVCEHCSEEIGQRAFALARANGQYKPYKVNWDKDNPKPLHEIITPVTYPENPKVVAYHVNALSCPWVSLVDATRARIEYLHTTDQTRRRIFVNSQAAEPWFEPEEA